MQDLKQPINLDRIHTRNIFIIVIGKSFLSNTLGHYFYLYGKLGFSFEIHKS
jgi:hypothetical protein